MQAQALVQGLAQVLTSPVKNYTCVNCHVGFESTAEQRSHFKTEWHLYNLKRKVCKLEPIDLTSFQEIQNLAPKAESTSANLDDDDSWEEMDYEELLDEDYDEVEIEQMLARVVKSNTCLFCDKKSRKIKENLDHMNVMHGFFIPEEQYLIDLEGFMEYLGFKVGAGMTCLWCNKQFTTLHGVRLHMLYKDHCKILYDQEKAIAEFKDFYDYSNQVQIAMKPLDQLVVSNKKRTRDSSAMVKRETKGSSQLVARSAHGAALATQTYHSRSIKKFNADRAKRLLHIGMQNNNAMRGRLRQQNPL